SRAGLPAPAGRLRSGRNRSRFLAAPEAEAALPLGRHFDGLRFRLLGHGLPVELQPEPEPEPELGLGLRWPRGLEERAPAALSGPLEVAAEGGAHRLDLALLVHGALLLHA